MTRARGGLVVVIVSIASLAVAAVSIARPVDTTPAYDPDAFVVIGPLGSGLAAELPTTIPDFPEPRRSTAPRPNASLAPAHRVVVQPRVVLPRVPTPSVGRSHQVSGRATWYCRPGISACTSGHSGGLYAAAGSELRIGNWRGRYVRVCSGGRCVVVRLIDTCACGGSRVIDLYSDAFRRLGPLSQGGLSVTVSW